MCSSPKIERFSAQIGQISEDIVCKKVCPSSNNAFVKVPKFSGTTLSLLVQKIRPSNVAI